MTAINDDVTPPTITGCPGNIAESAPSGASGAIAQWIEPRATDNSGTDPFRTTNYTPGREFPVGTTRVTYTFTDEAGNSAICSFNVVVNTGAVHKVLHIFFLIFVIINNREFARLRT